MAKHGAEAIAKMVSGSRDGARLLEALGARSMLEAITTDPDSSVKAQAGVRNVLATWDRLSFPEASPEVLLQLLLKSVFKMSSTHSNVVCDASTLFMNYWAA